MIKIPGKVWGIFRSYTVTEVLSMTRGLTVEENEIAKHPVLDLENLVELVPRWRLLLEYDSRTGLLHSAMLNADNPDRIASRPGRGGENFVRLDGHKVPASHAVWLLHHGAWPEAELFRKDGDPGNDRIENLKPGTRPVATKRPVGVARHGTRWQAYYRDDRGQKFLGVYDTKEEAIAARAAYDRGEEVTPSRQRRERRRKWPKGVARYGVRWQAYYRDGYEQKFLGVFDTMEEAAERAVAYERGDDLV